MANQQAMLFNNIKSPKVHPSFVEQRGVDETKDIRIPICAQDDIYAVFHDCEKTARHQADLKRDYDPDLGLLDNQVGSRHYLNFLSFIKDNTTPRSDTGELDMLIKQQLHLAIKNQIENPHRSSIPVLKHLICKKFSHTLVSRIHDYGDTILNCLWRDESCPFSRSLFYQAPRDSTQPSYDSMVSQILGKHRLLSCHTTEHAILFDEVYTRDEELYEFLKFLEDLHSWPIWNYYGKVYNKLALLVCSEKEKEIKQNGTEFIMWIHNEIHAIIVKRIDKMFNNFPRCYKYLCLNKYLRLDETKCEISQSSETGLTRFLPKAWKTPLPYDFRV